ncbi:hypothetical protein A2803_02795 [Candidatus Woesebacteria bacterium RIFCSPHIGHO2_01_FULL_44_21]|uniref:VWFA domain-containing protein n=1 Tax=Candidatus Woesebacteria bacterium RIFCSPHIGHO2_01_FULL_44_21 TaxID=1802503 RepID=A0A1F7YXE0_9BACT|nr:MAG: hypothetical protein A2803_02795 [Candidatus Woesebacteria bacterium RIFCSPHIGHO2_01_FULL_44_21]OGM69799.1 MAG: hypothetical protein A2897_00450 [Candidatus Woesebacteria bacterium RIFCSPLOWO2_01_FULL_44_24b]
MSKKLQNGAITAIFLAVVALVLTLILAATQSQLLLSIRRSQSAADILIATYGAESEVNDIMAKLSGGYLADADIARTTKNIGDTTLTIEGEDQGETQIVTVTASRGYAVGKVQGIRRVLSVEEVDDVELVLTLDCTSSMDARDASASCTGSSCPTRFNALEEAAINFVNNIERQEDADKFKLGVAIFGKSSAWLQSNGRDITPESGMSFSEIRTAIEAGINTVRRGGQCERVLDGTSIGTAYRHGHNYLVTTKNPDTKQIEIVITDGEPNSRTTDSACPPSIACGPNSACEPAAKNYLRCTLADNLTFVPEISQNGARDPEVDAYAVTIFDRPPTDVVTIFRNYATEDGYFNASRASELTNILEGILDKILEDRSTVTIKRVIPTLE